MRRINIAVVGVGAVGIEMCRILIQRGFPLGEFKIFARSARTITIDGQVYQVEEISPEGFEGIDIALFAGTEGEKGAAVMYGPEAVKRGAIVIDNGSDFRLKEEVPLIVPEVNPQRIKEHRGIIANPNCTTIQMVVALAGIYKEFGLEEVILTSFQATSGAGRRGTEELWVQIKDVVDKNKDSQNAFEVKKVSGFKPEIFTRQIGFNVIAQIGEFKEYGYTTEEWKVVKEAQKIFEDFSLKITATCVRVPVFTGHSEAIYFKTKREADLDEVSQVLESSPGVKFFKDPQKFPTPLEAEGKDEVFVGRLRENPFSNNSFWFWVISDNLRKGAALNAVQIAEFLFSLT